LAWDIATAEGGSLTALHILPQTGEVDMAIEMDVLRQLVEDVLEEIPQEVAFSLKRSNSIVEGVLAASAQIAGQAACDLIVIGASEEWFLRDMLFGSIPDVVAERAPCSVLLVRKHEPSSVSWVRRMARRVGGE
jgi:nucleotide-binding universal stress UspA family protein